MRAFILLAVLALAYGERIKGTFEVPDYAAFKAKWNKSYGVEQEDAHYAAYLKSVEYVNNHNAEYDQGEHTFWCGINEWSDMTDEERDTRNGLMIPDEIYDGPRRNGDASTAPDSVDWREQGAVNHVKNQGACGSCWAFAAICSLEGQWAINKGSLPDASEQQLVSCDRSSSMGCNGGYPCRAYDYVHKQGTNGVDTQTSYPYHATTGTCDTAKTSDGQDVAATANGPHMLAESEDALKEAVGNVGPVSIALAASGAFQHYSGGILDTPSCSGSINHAVTAVGYDTAQNYWIVRNSWGSSWGESGYVRIVMGKNMCNMINHFLCYPEV